MSLQTRPRIVFFNKVICRSGHMIALTILAVLTCSGCGNGEKIKKAGGIVTVDGKPSSAGTIEFYPVGGGRTANAVIQDDGTFTISYRRPGDGLPPGEYKVAIIVDKVIDSPSSPRKENEDLQPGMEDDGFIPSTKIGAVEHIVPKIYNSIETTPYRQTIEDDGKKQHLEIKISTK